MIQSIAPHLAIHLSAYIEPFAKKILNILCTEPIERLVSLETSIIDKVGFIANCLSPKILYILVSLLQTDLDSTNSLTTSITYLCPTFLFCCLSLKPYKGRQEGIIFVLSAGVKVNHFTITILNFKTMMPT